MTKKGLMTMAFALLMWNVNAQVYQNDFSGSSWQTKNDATVSGLSDYNWTEGSQNNNRLEAQYSNRNFSYEFDMQVNSCNELEITDIKFDLWFLDPGIGGFPQNGDVSVMINGDPASITGDNNKSNDNLNQITASLSSNLVIQGVQTITIKVEGERRRVGTSFTGYRYGDINIDNFTINGSINETLPTVNFSSNTVEALCQGETTDIEILLTGVAPWSLIYSIDGGTPVTETILASPYTINDASAGEYVIHSLSDANCAASVLDTIEVQSNTLPEFNFLVEDAVVETKPDTVYLCLDQPYPQIKLDVIPVTSPTTTYNYLVEHNPLFATAPLDIIHDANHSGGLSQIPTVNGVEGYYKITVTDNATGCQTIKEYFIKVNDKPSTGDIVFSATQICEGEDFIITYEGLPNEEVIINYTIGNNLGSFTGTPVAGVLHDTIRGLGVGTHNFEFLNVAATVSNTCLTNYEDASHELVVTPTPSFEYVTIDSRLYGDESIVDTICLGDNPEIIFHGLTPNTQQTITYTVNLGNEYTLVVTSDGNGEARYESALLANLNIIENYFIVIEKITINGCETLIDSNNEIKVSVQGRPDLTAGFTVSGDYCAGEEVTFSAATNSVSALSYTFYGPYGLIAEDDDLTASNAYDTAFNVYQSGEYFFAVESAYGCVDTFKTTITVNPLPEFEVLINDDYIDGFTICSGGEVSINPQVRSIPTLLSTMSSTITYELTGPGITTPITVFPYTFNANNSHDGEEFTVVATTSEGCTDTFTFEINVNPLPSFQVTVNGNEVLDGGTAFICTPWPMTINVINVDFTDSFAIFKAGHSTEIANGGLPTQGHAYNINTTTAGINGLYYAIGYNTETDCFDTLKFTIESAPIPVIVAKVNGDNIINRTTTHCEGEAVVFGFSGGNDTYVLIDSDADTVVGNNATGTFDFGNISVDQAGDYKLIVTNASGCYDSFMYEVIVNPLPEIELTINGGLLANNNFTTCTGDDIEIEFENTSDAVVNYTLKKVGGTSLKNGNLSIGSLGFYTITNALVNASGNYIIELENAVTGCTDVVEFEINVNPLPENTLSVNGIELENGDTTVHCAGTDMEFNINGDAGAFEVFFSKTKNGTYTSIATGTVGDSYVENNIDTSRTGWYKFLYTSNLGCENTAEYFVQVNAAPQLGPIPNQVYVANPGQCDTLVPYSMPAIYGIPTPSIRYIHSGATVGEGNNSTGSGARFNVGVTDVMVIAENSCGSDTTHLTVTVIDNQNPIVDLGIFEGAQEMYVDASGCVANLVVNPGDISITDNCTDSIDIELSWAISGATADSGTGPFLGYSALNVGNNTITITAKDESGNITISSFDVLVDGRDVLITIDSSVDATCYGGTGTVYYTYVGSVENTPYTVHIVDTTNAGNNIVYTATNPQTFGVNFSHSGIPAGTYVIRFTDKFGCISYSIDDFVIGQPDEIILTVVGTEPSCLGDLGSLDFSVSGGTNTTYKVEVFVAGSSTPTTTMPNVVAFNNYVVQNLSTGSYEVKVTDLGNGCSVTESFTVEDCAGVDLTPFAIIVDPVLSNNQKSTNMDIYVQNVGSLATNEQITITVFKGSALINLAVANPMWTVQNNGGIATITSNVSVPANSFVEINATFEVLGALPNPGIISITTVTSSNEDNNTDNNGAVSTITIYSN